MVQLIETAGGGEKLGKFSGPTEGYVGIPLSEGRMMHVWIGEVSLGAQGVWEIS